jgi:hypothetical protein
MTGDQLPDHLERYAQDTRDLLGLQDWTITIKLVDEIDGDPRTGGQCSYLEPYRIAHILIRRDQAEEKLREHLMHELLHAALAPLDYAAQTAVDLVPKPQRKVAKQMLYDGCERAVVALAKALIRGLRPPAQDTA